ncbi:MAG TPA: copper chaperone PCu(A)C [Usitatibacter sp.]|nr:copper chaperone PCu(A)C [Usitatibacter sp.]
MRKLFAAMGLAAALAAFPLQAAITVKDAWVRGTVPGQSTTGAFMTVHSDAAAKIVGVSSPLARRAEIHASEMKDGIMRMRPAGPVTLPAGRDVPLQGELHVMLLDVARTLGAQDRVPLVLTIEDAHGKRSQVHVVAPVKPLGQ